MGSCPAGPYLIMELLRGQILAHRLDQGALPLDEALRVADELARGLAHAHEHGVIHRDLTPANACLCEDGGVKMLDRGLAHLLGSEGPGQGGTPDFMAPEQACGEPVDERADVYALGTVPCQILTGKLPRDPEGERWVRRVSCVGTARRSTGAGLPACGRLFVAPRNNTCRSPHVQSASSTRTLSGASCPRSRAEGSHP